MERSIESVLVSIKMAESRINMIQEILDEAKSWLSNAKTHCDKLAQPTTSSGPKVQGKVQLGNIEQCFREAEIEDQIQEMEEDFFDGY